MNYRQDVEAELFAILAVGIFLLAGVFGFCFAIGSIIYGVIV